MCDRIVSLLPIRVGAAILGPTGQKEPRASRLVRGWWDRRGRGRSGLQLPQRERAGEQRPVAVAGQVVAVVCGVEDHDQRTTVVVTDKKARSSGEALKAA